LGHLPLNFSINQGEGVPSSEGNDFNRNGGGLASESADFSQNQTAQKLGIPTPETPSTQAIDLGHLPLNFSINQGEGVPSSEGGEIEVVITETKPIFDPEFIRKVKYKNRAWLSQVETHFLLERPEIAKLLQQRRWYKKLQVFSDPNEPDCVKRMNLSTYKSDWLKVHTLLEMGIEFFLKPESRWTQDSPEAIEFWEKGKDTRRAKYIGTTVGDSNPCEYVGRVLDKLDIKRKRDRPRNESGEKIRVYRVDTDYLSSPMRSAVYECVKQRVESVVQTDSLVLNWDAIAENTWANQTDQKLDTPTPETPSTQPTGVGHLPPNSLNNQGLRVPVLESDPVTELIEALPYCDTPQIFAAVVENYSSEAVEDAIALQDSQPRRSELQRMWEVVTDVRFLRSVTDWSQVVLSQERLDEVWQLLDATEQNRLVNLCQAAQRPVERQWGVTRSQVQDWQGCLEWIRGGLVRVAYAAIEYVRLTTGEYVRYTELRMPG
jgi:hypothetical protein